MRIAYLCSRYPAPSLTFIQREVLALRERGLEIETFAVRRANEHEVLSRADRQEFARTYAILPARLFDLVSAHLMALLRHPRAYGSTLLRSLRLSRGGLRATLWRLFYFGEAVLLWRQCARREVTHVHAHLANVGSDLAMLAAHLGREAGGSWSWSFTMHGSAEFYDVADHRLPEKVRDARFVICVSDFTRSQLMMWLGHDQWRKLHVVHCAIDTEVFRREMERDGVPDSLHVLTVSRLVLGKGLTFLLESVAQLRDRGLEVSLTVVGDGPERPALEDQARRLRIEDRVRLLGAIGQDEIRESYAVADAFCLPSFAEGVPVVLMEAMAMQLPVVATRITGVPELVEHGHSGLLVTPARSEELADALERLARSPEERHALGAAGRDKVLSDFELSRSADALARLYREELQV